MNTAMISIVIPCYNEEDVIESTLTILCEKLSEYQIHNYEIIIVDDLSFDNSLQKIESLANQNQKIKVITLSANKGQQIAIYAGICYTSGDVTILMDADLQDPPDCIPDMIKLWEQGYHVVYGKRMYRDGETFFKKITSYLFYRLLDKLSYTSLPVDVGEFRLMDRCVVDTIAQIGEHCRFNRALVSWLGFKQIELAFDRPPRIAGETKFTIKSLMSLAKDGLFSFSNAPIYLIQFIGLFSMICSCFLIVYILFSRFFGSYTSGWTSLMIVVTLLFGTSLFSIGIVGEYILRIYKQVIDRPIFLPMKTTNLKDVKLPQQVKRFISPHNKDLN